eukprot:6842342-Prymnesium_polylepis.1
MEQHPQADADVLQQPGVVPSHCVILEQARDHDKTSSSPAAKHPPCAALNLPPSTRRPQPAS